MGTSLTGYQGMAGPSGRTGNKIPKGFSQGQFQQFNPQQMQLFQQMFGQVGPESYLSRLAGGDQDLFNQMEAPAMRQFSALQGNIASKFSGGGGGPGAMSSRRSSAFQNNMGQEASAFAQDLQSQRQTLQRQAISDLMGMSNQLLGQRPYDQFIVEKQQKSNPWSSFASGLGGAIPGAAMGFLTGGPGGAIAGGASGAYSGVQNAARNTRG